MDEPALDLRDFIFDRASSEEGGISLMDRSFSAVSLHDRSKHSWAVIGDASGAIASRADGALLMRMGEEDAHLVAAQLTVDARRVPTTH